MPADTKTQERDAFLALAATFKPWPRNSKSIEHFHAEWSFAKSFTKPPAGQADLRKNGLLSTPKHQHLSQACTSFAVAAAAEAAVRKKLYPPVTLAPWFIHTCLLQRAPDAGARIDEVTAKVSGVGIAYTTNSDSPFPPGLCSTPNRLHLAGINEIPDAQAAKVALDGKDVVVATLLVRWQDFLDLGSNSVYAYSPDYSASPHSVCLVGYDDAAGSWIIQNSQGEGWSDRGFGRVAYGSCGMFDPFTTGSGATMYM